jgi:hypothetical protein
MAFDERGHGNPARRRWKRIRTSVTLLMLIGVVVGAAWYSWHDVIDQQAAPSIASTHGPCTPGPPTAAPPPAKIQINVYNSTDRAGLASSVARKMRGRGFTVVDVDNDPLRKTIDGPAEVRSRLDQQAAASLVASLVPGAVYVPDDRSNAVVDLVLGETFEKLMDPTAASAAATGLPPCEAPSR